MQREFVRTQEWRYRAFREQRWTTTPSTTQHRLPNNSVSQMQQSNVPMWAYPLENGRVESFTEEQSHDEWQKCGRAAKTLCRSYTGRRQLVVSLRQQLPVDHYRLVPIEQSGRRRIQSVAPFDGRTNFPGTFHSSSPTRRPFPQQRLKKGPQQKRAQKQQNYYQQQQQSPTNYREMSPPDLRPQQSRILAFYPDETTQRSEWMVEEEEERIGGEDVGRPLRRGSAQSSGSSGSSREVVKQKRQQKPLSSTIPPAQAIHQRYVECHKFREEEEEEHEEEIREQQLRKERTRETPKPIPKPKQLPPPSSHFQQTPQNGYEQQQKSPQEEKREEGKKITSAPVVAPGQQKGTSSDPENEVVNELDGFHIRVEAIGFTDTDFKVYIDTNHVLALDGEHVEDNGNGTVTVKKLNRRWKLAEDVDLRSVRAYLAADGHVEISGEKLTTESKIPEIIEEGEDEQQEEEEEGGEVEEEEGEEVRRELAEREIQNQQQQQHRQHQTSGYAQKEFQIANQQKNYYTTEEKLDNFSSRREEFSPSKLQKQNGRIVHPHPPPPPLLRPQSQQQTFFAAPFPPPSAAEQHQQQRHLTTSRSNRWGESGGGVGGGVEGGGGERPLHHPPPLYFE